MQVDDAHNTDVVIPIYNLIENIDNYSKKIGILWQYCRDKPALADNNDIIHFNEGNAASSFDLKGKITGKTGNNDTKNVETIVPLKYLSNFWRTLEIPLINYEINLI